MIEKVCPYVYRDCEHVTKQNDEIFKRFCATCEHYRKWRVKQLEKEYLNKYGKKTKR